MTNSNAARQRFQFLYDAGNIIFLLATLIVITIGGGTAWWESNAYQRFMSGAALSDARMIAAAINPERVARLTGTEQDYDSADYQYLQDRLIRIQEANPNYRYLYLLGKRGEEPPFFFMGTAPRETPEYSPPGQPYPEAPPSLNQVFDTKAERVSPPVTDRWGVWISALIPIFHPRTGELMAVFGMDIDANEWRNQIRLRLLIPLAVTTSAVMALVMAAFLLRYRDSKRENRLLTNKAEETQALVESLRQEVQARRKAEEEMRYSRKFLDDVLEAASEVAIISGDADGTIRLFNRGAERMLGYTAEEVIGRCTPMLFHEASELTARRKELSETLGRPIEGFEVFTAYPSIHGSESREWTYVRKDGTRLTVSLVITPVRDEANGITGYLGIALDFTRRHAAEEALRYEKRFSEQLLDSLPGIFYLYDSDLRLRRWNRNHETATGFSAEELSGRPLALWHNNAENRDKITAYAKIVLSEGGAAQMETPITNKDGSQTSYLLTGTRLKTVNGPMLMGVGIDISARIQTENALRENEAFFRQMTEQSPFSTSVFAPDGAILQVNEAHLKLWGITWDLVKNYNILEDRQAESMGLMPYFQKAFTGERVTTPEVEYDLSATIGAGDRKIVSGDFYPLRGAEGTLRHVVLIHQDVTERRKAQREVIENERQFRAIFDNAPYAIALHDWDTGLYIDVNKAFVDSIGVPKEALLRMRAQDVVSISDEQARHIRELLLEMGVIQGLESTVMDKDGSPAFIVYSLVLIEIQGKKRILSVSEDITKRRRAEMALRESEERLRAIGDNLPGGMIYQVVQKPDGKTCFAYLSAGVELLHGYTVAEVMDNAALLYDQVLPEDIDRMLSEEKKALDTLGIFDMEVRFKHRSGEIYWRRLISKPRRLENGDITADGIEIDITERKRIEEKLRESERRYSQAIAAASDAIWEWEIATNKTYFNPHWYEMLGYADREFEMSLDAWKELLYPDDFENAMLRIQDTLSDPNIAYSAEFRLRAKDGSWKWILSRGQIVAYDAEGKPALLSGTHTDITARKHAEILLTESRQLLRDVLNTVPVRVFWKDLQSRYLGCNIHFAIDAGCNTPEEVIGKTDYDLRWRKVAALHQQYDQEVASTGIPKLFYDEPLANPDGSVTWLRKSKIPLRNPEGKTIGVLGVFEDVTERKAAEEQLLQEKRFSDRLLESMPGIFYLFDNRMILERWNKSLEMSTGYTGAELKQMRLPQDWFAEEDWEEITRAIEAALQGGEVTIAAPIRKKSGELVPYQFTATLFETPEKPMLMGIGLDISERQRAEEALRQAHDELELKVQQRTAELRVSEERFRTLFSASNDAVLVLNNDLFVECNEAALHLFGCERFEDFLGKHPAELSPPVQPCGVDSTTEDFLGKHPAELSPPVQPCGVDSTTLAKEYIATAVREGRHFFEWTHRRFDGTDFPCEIMLSPMVLNDKPILQVVIRDVTERKQAEAALERAKLRLEAANKELEAFSYSVSHDLRAPLRAIDGFSQALLEDYGDRLDDDGREYLNRVRKGAQRMGTLIDDMLTLSRLTRGELRIENVDLSALAGQVLEELHHGEPSREVISDIQPGVIAQGDPRMLSAVMSNLLGNAWKFTSKREQARISFGMEVRNGEKVYCVRDNGAGFNPAYADKLFGTFQRLHTAEEFPGTGVGLATVQRIIHRHGGRVWAEAALEKGASFYFVLGRA